MALKSGLNAQIGFVAESTYGTAVTVTRFVPLVSESVSQEIERNESEGIITGARVLRSQQWSAGNKTISGDVGLELYDRSIGLLFTHMFGTVNTTGSGPYTHTFTPGDLTGKSLTMQIGRPNTLDGTVHPFTFAGTKITEWELAGAAGEIATLGLSVVSKSETTATALATASFASSIAPITFLGGSVTLAGSAYKTRNFTLSGDNGLKTDRRFIGDGTIDEPLEAALRTYSGTIDSELFDLTAYNRFVNGTEAALVLALAKGTTTCTITMNVRFDGDSPNVDGPDVVGNMLPFKCVGPTTDATAITAVLVNGDATP